MKMTRHTRVINLIGIINDLLPETSLGASQVKFISEQYFNNGYKRIITKGKAEAVNHYKTLFLFARNIALGLPLPPAIPFTKTSKEGVPKVLIPLLPLLRGNSNDKKVALTICRFYESITCKPKPDISPITEEYSGKVPLEFPKFREFLEGKLPLIVGKLKSPDNFKVMNRLTKGPNGHSMLTAHYDAVAVCEDKDLLSSFIELGQIYPRGNRFLAGMIKQANFTKQLLPDGQFHTGRISMIPEPGGKTRLIAIGDYWSQTALRPFHNILMKILKRLETDGTGDQTSQFERIKKSASNPSYSFDLSSATDRFPIELQQHLVGTLYGDRFASVGRRMMTNRGFHNNQGEDVRGSTGQPLGMYSSGAVFALTHHMVIEYLAFKEGIKSFREYAVLGDDVVIGNQTVARSYSEFMKDIGVPINLNKSVISTPESHCIEFAKRQILNGEEVTGLKFTILDQTATSLNMGPDLARLCDLRSGQLDWHCFPGASGLRESQLRSLVILLAERGHLTRPILGVTFDDQFIKRLKIKTYSLRIDRLIEQRNRIGEYLSGNKPIDQFFKSEGIECNATQLGLDGVKDGVLDIHPIVFELNQRGEQVIELLDTLGTLEDIAEHVDELPLLPVEYIPLVDNSVFFGDKQKLRTKYHSNLVITALKLLLEDQEQ